MAGTPVFLSHPASLAHDTGSHPERAARITAIEQELAAQGWLGFERVQSRAVERDVLEAVHPRDYIDTIEAAARSGGAHLDPDTIVGDGSFEAALHSAGGAAQAVDMLLDGAAPYAFSCHRPPGHHALAARAMGFCLFNNVAVAAQHAVSARGLERVMIFDWDVHHGNGTNDIFAPRADVLYVSIHESPLYPGTGPARDVGSGPGEGYTVNVPVPAGSGDAVFVSATEHLVAPLARAFAPQLLLVSAGFDAHTGDPLATCTVTEAGFASMTAIVRDVAGELEVPLGIVLEGGYALEPLARSVAAALAVLVSGESPSPVEVAPLVADARERLARWWPLIS